MIDPLLDLKNYLKWTNYFLTRYHGVEGIAFFSMDAETDIQVFQAGTEWL